MAIFFLAVCILVSVPNRAWGASAYSAFTLYHKISFVWFHFDRFFFLLIIIFRGYFLHLIDVAVFGGGFLHFVFVREDQDHLCLHFIGSATRALGNNNKNGEA